MDINEFFMSVPPPAAYDVDDHGDLLPPLTLPLIPPQLHFQSSSFLPQLHLRGFLDFDTVLSSFSSATTVAATPLPVRSKVSASPDPGDESSRDGSSISEQVPWNGKCLDGGKAKGLPSKFAEEGDGSVITKRSREDGEVDGGDGIGPAKQLRLGNGGGEEGSKKKKKKDDKGGGGGGGGSDGVEPPKDYIHVRARRGQATDSHSLAERARREKISERMKTLQDLVPSCSKVTGKTLMLDEIINYVQSLQRQVEFLSMKLASVNTSLHYSMNKRITSKDMLRSSSTITTTAAADQRSMFAPSLRGKTQEGTNFKYFADPPAGIPPSSGLNDQILAPFRGEDLHSIVEMGLLGKANPPGFNGEKDQTNNG